MCKSQLKMYWLSWLSNGYQMIIKTIKCLSRLSNDYQEYQIIIKNIKVVS